MGVDKVRREHGCGNTILAQRVLCQQVSLWINLGVIWFKTWNHTHWKCALFVHVGGCFSSTSFPLRTYHTVRLFWVST